MEVLSYKVVTEDLAALKIEGDVYRSGRVPPSHNRIKRPYQNYQYDHCVYLSSGFDYSKTLPIDSISMNCQEYVRPTLGWWS